MGRSEQSRICFGGTETTGRCVAVKQGGKVAEGLIVEGFLSKEENFEMDALGDWEPVEFVKDRRVMWSRERV